MATFEITTENCLGISHSGGVYAEGNGTIELSDQEVAALVALIREKGTSDVNELGLKDAYPEIYKKMDEAYHAVAYNAEEKHWLWEGYYDGCFEFDPYELMEYCESECGFTFESDDDEYLDEEGELDEEAYEEAKLEAFTDDWLESFLYSLDDDDLKKFFYEHLNASVEMDGVEYEVHIPEAIIGMAEA